jgi:hypothetical protein
VEDNPRGAAKIHLVNAIRATEGLNMKVGYLCRYTAEEIAFATQAGFGSIQLLIYPGDPLDPARTSEDEIKAARDAYAEAGIEVSALGYYGNHLDPDADSAAAVREHFVALLDLAGTMGVDCIGTFAGRDPEKSVLDNIPAFAEVFSGHAKLAEDRGMTIGFENCPMFHYFPFRGVNIAYCPEAWDRRGALGGAGHRIRPFPPHLHVHGLPADHPRLRRPDRACTRQGRGDRVARGQAQRDPVHGRGAASDAGNG